MSEEDDAFGAFGDGGVEDGGVEESGGGGGDDIFMTEESSSAPPAQAKSEDEIEEIDAEAGVQEGVFDDLPAGDVDPGDMNLADNADYGQTIEGEVAAGSALATWEAKRTEQLKKRGEDDEQAREDIRQKAAEELAAFNLERQTKQDKTKKAVRQEEKNESSALKELMSSGSTWEKVAKYVDTRKPKDHVEAEKTDRMRTMIVDLKSKKAENPNRA
eukprot:gb/GEZN01012423.1/.p1 GENE.gb/GEZN01012423.1/~~gb/GEZN01012423.1/.p1  ORF type:complete len:216 (+),score=61.43 gb/GEZN01012423.1/:327-974(+)